MADSKLDIGKVTDFLKSKLKDISDSTKVRFRELNKAISHEFGQGLFIPKLSSIVNSIRPDLSKPKRGKAGRKGKRRGRRPGRPPGRPAGARRATGGAFLVKVGRKMSLARSKDRVQAIIDKMVAAGQSLGRLKVFALTQVGVSTRVTLE